jgi:hypothetical protein
MALLLILPSLLNAPAQASSLENEKEEQTSEFTMEDFMALE